MFVYYCSLDMQHCSTTQQLMMMRCRLEKEILSWKQMSLMMVGWKDVWSVPASLECYRQIMWKKFEEEHRRLHWHILFSYLLCILFSNIVGGCYSNVGQFYCSLVVYNNNDMNSHCDIMYFGMAHVYYGFTKLSRL